MRFFLRVQKKHAYLSHVHKPFLYEYTLCEIIENCCYLTIFDPQKHQFHRCYLIFYIMGTLENVQFY